MHVACREVVLCWDGPALSAGEAADLLAQLAEPPAARDSTARLLVALPADRPALVEPWLDALQELRSGPAARAGAALPGLRLCCDGLPDEPLRLACRLEAEDARLSFAACEPEPLLITGSVLGRRRAPRARRRPARAARVPRGARARREPRLPGPRVAGGAALDRRGALAAAQPHRPARVRATVARPRRAVRLDRGGRGAAGRGRTGPRESPRPRGRDGRARARRPRSCGDRRPRIGRPDAAARERFGRLDLQAFPDARDRLPLAGHREGFRYDGAVPLAPGADADAAGEHAALAATRLGLPPDAPAPRSTGSADQRVDFLRAFARVVAHRRDVAPCG